MLVAHSGLWGVSATVTYVVASITVQLVVSIPTLVTALYSTTSRPDAPSEL